MATVHVVPGLVAKRKAIEKERVKDGLRRWIAAKWRGEVQEREEMVRHHDEAGYGDLLDFGSRSVVESII
ncbi:hypothetical protein HC256_008433 [Beauveria bassiana]|nr:hypothetical protein HC256_008433 [Beauveria bassiana]